MKHVALNNTTDLTLNQIKFYSSREAYDPMKMQGFNLLFTYYNIKF